MQHVFIVGSKGIPGAYGGYETFVDKLTEYHQNNKNLKYHVACKDSVSGEFEYHNAHCFKIKVPDIGPAQAIYYDVAALDYCCKYIQKHHIEHPIVYILACRIGPFAAHFQKKIHKFGGQVFVNPDGACGIMGSTGEKPVKSRLRGDSVFYPNSNSEYHKIKSYSGFLKRFCFMPPEFSRYIIRVFFCWTYLKPCIYNPRIA